MALTQPFITDLSAFDADSTGKDFYVNILGGDKVTRIDCYVYDAETDEIVDGAVDANLSIIIPQDGVIESEKMSFNAKKLFNDKSYYMYAVTSNATGTSVRSPYKYFKCYETPTYKLEYLNNNGEYIVLHNDDGLNRPSATFRISALAYPQPLNSVKLEIYRGDIPLPPQTLIFSAENYELPWVVNVNDLPNLGTINLAIKITCETVDGMICGLQYNVKNDYEVVGMVDENFYATNNCSAGTIDITNSLDINTVKTQNGFTKITSNSIIVVPHGSVIESDKIVIVKDDDTSSMGLAKLLPSMKYNYYANEVYYDIILRVVGTDSSGAYKVVQFTSEVYSQFNKSLIVDKTNVYDITNEWTSSGGTYNQVTALYTPYGRKYPLVGKNALTGYRSDTYSAILLASTPTVSATFDRTAQRLLIKQFNEWLANGMGKVIKTINGDLIVCAIVEAVGNSYYKDFANGLASTSFSWVEIGEMNTTDLTNIGLL